MFLPILERLSEPPPSKRIPGVSAKLASDYIRALAAHPMLGEYHAGPILEHQEHLARLLYEEGPKPSAYGWRLPTNVCNLTSSGTHRLSLERMIPSHALKRELNTWTDNLLRNYKPGCTNSFVRALRHFPSMEETLTQSDPNLTLLSCYEIDGRSNGRSVVTIHPLLTTVSQLSEESTGIIRAWEQQHVTTQPRSFLYQLCQ
jgi:hypothetical protein